MEKVRALEYRLVSERGLSAIERRATSIAKAAAPEALAAPHRLIDTLETAVPAQHKSQRLDSSDGSATHDLHAVATLYPQVKSHAVRSGSARNWYTTGAIELRLAELTGDGEFLHAAAASLNHASKALRQQQPSHLLSEAGQVHKQRIFELKTILYDKLAEQIR